MKLSVALINLVMAAEKKVGKVRSVRYVEGFRARVFKKCKKTPRHVA